MGKLSAAQVKAALKDTPAWNRKGSAISRTYQFKGFIDAVKFVNAVAKIAERAKHHPGIDIRWNKVRLHLTPHDAGGLTEKDFQLASRCDQVPGAAVSRQ